MRGLRFIFLCIIFGLGSFGYGEDQASEFKKVGKSEKMKPVLNQALQGKIDGALDLIRKVPEGQLTPLEQGFRKAFLDRFDKAPVEPQLTMPLPDALLAAYQYYWTVVARGDMKAEDGEKRLKEKLEKLLFADSSATGWTWEQVEALAREKLETQGYKAILGVTAPYREFMIWKTEHRKTYTVDLVDARQAVQVVFMRDFKSLGWAHYFTLGVYHTGGWAADDKLFCVDEVYDKTSEVFKVSYLAHEGQHFADYKKFPKLTPAELEYRAKLVELVKARQTSIDLLQFFSENGEENSPNPHAQANFRVAQNMRSHLFGQSKQPIDWSKIPVQRIQKAARALFSSDTKQRLGQPG